MHVTDHHRADPRLARSLFKELPFASDSGRVGVEEFTDGFLSGLSSVLSAASANGKLDADVPKMMLAHSLYAQWQVLMRRLVTDRLDYDDMVLHDLPNSRERSSSCTQ